MTNNVTVGVVGEGDLLETAIGIAVAAHKGQVDLAGMPYILHPLRVMMVMKTEDEMAAAILHDVIEDTGITIGHLRGAGISSRVVEAVRILTKRKGEPYENYLARVESNGIARTVKVGDLYDNLRLYRLKTVTDKDLKRMEKYRKALTRLRIT